jgi:hypothetical protein
MKLSTNYGTSLIPDLRMHMSWRSPDPVAYVIDGFEKRFDLSLKSHRQLVEFMFADRLCPKLSGGSTK